ncbi:hypothetical protein [Neisseria leonii]|uniref:hypothetical protein n=1 Tax=Neisseria leonii TaxID=2995413 RepID=UPI00237C3915|nr:hypothetical protein [Neisseria sp. 3986]MDD9325602.1 hypothetical protein [Neisseria sp. 3986]
MTQIQWQKPVCQLDADGLYLGRTTAELDIYTRDGSYLMPAGCIDAEPPETREGFAARWNTGTQSWDYIEDLRGRTAYRTGDGQAVVIDTVGALSDGLTLEPRPSPAHDWQDGRWVENKKRAAELAAAALAEAKKRRLAELSRAAQAHIDAAVGADKVPAYEIQSWIIQGTEAKAWAADNSAATPVLDGIAAARGIPAGILKAAALRKTLAYEQLAAHTAGQRQALETRIEAAQTAEAAEAVEIAFTLPETA